MPPDSLSAEQWIAVLEALGFYRWTGDAEPWFMNSDRTRKLGPAGVFFDFGSASTLPLSIGRLYLLARGLDEQALDAAIARVAGD